MKFRMMLQTLALALAIGLLAGCTTTAPTNADGSTERPLDVEVLYAADKAFRHLRGRLPVDPQIDSLKQMAVFITHIEYVACISVEEKRVDPSQVCNALAQRRRPVVCWPVRRGPSP